MDASVRQGCPLSPLLYAIVAEVLLDRIEKECPDMLVRAYADDTAVVTTDFQRDAPKLQRIFEEFGRISGLHLNGSKSVVIPLSVGTLDAFRTRLTDVVPDWNNMMVAYGGTYLGFSVGPQKKDQSWTKGAAKFEARVNVWGKQPLGLHYAAMTYNTFAMTVLGYICQLEEPPDWLLAQEEVALRTVAKGPGAIWSYLEQSGTIWSYLEPSGAIWSYLDLSGAIWSYLKPN